MEKIKKYISYACYIAIGIFIILKFVIKIDDLLDAISYAVSGTSIICIVYSTILWKINPLEKYPRLNKEYKGVIKTERYGNREIKLYIKHNLLYTYVKAITEESCSKSKSFNIFQDGEDWILIYNYLNEPNILERKHSDIHFGTCVLDITNKNKLIGKYYTDRQTIGHIEAEVIDDSDKAVEVD